MIEYAYLLWALFALLLWVLVYLAVPWARREMLILSVIFALLGPGIYFHTLDYFSPTHLGGGWWGVEDVIIGFAYAGLAASVYELLRYDRGERVQRVGYWLFAVGAITLSVAWMFFAPVLGLNSLHAFVILGLALGASICIARPRLTRNAVLSASAFTVAHTFFYLGFFALFPDALSWWKLENVSGTLLWGIPIEEFAWVFAWGFSVGPASELVARVPIPHWVEKRLALSYIRK